MPRARKRPNADGIRQWAEMTWLGFETMRAGERAKDPRADERVIERRVRARLARQRRASLAAWRGHG
jgi:hypothetical protein